MGVLNRIKGLFLSEEERDAHDLKPQVRRFYVDAMHRAAQLRAQAGTAPHAAGRDGLRQLAESEDEVARRLGKIIHDLGSFAGDVTRAPEPIGALNYWGRLAQALEAHKAAIKDLLDEATLITDSHPQLADELRALARIEDGHGARLRALIAKSDPQALD